MRKLPKDQSAILAATLVLVTLGVLAAYLLPRLSRSPTPPGPQPSPGQSVEFPVRVEPAVELFSIIHRLAGTGQYDEMELPEYIEDVWDHFGPFRDHPAVSLAREMNQDHVINGNAPMDLAVHLTPPPELELRAPIALVLDDLDSRWNADLIPPLLEAAREFALDTDFQAFFRAHQPFYDEAVASLTTTLADTEMLTWFQEFFGGAAENYVVVLGLLNGSCNYGSRVTFPDGSQEFVSMLGGLDPDRDGVPRYARSRFVPTIVHEFSHSYVNPLVDRNREALQPSGEALFAHLEEALQRWGYNHWYVMEYEYLVRASTLRYLEAAQGPGAARARAREDQEAGFLGVPELADLLGEYEADRTIYPDLDAFLPRVEEFFRGVADWMGSR